MFFKPTPVVESIPVAMDWEEADMIMDWEDVPDIPWTVINNIEQSRMRAHRLRRAARQRRVTLDLQEGAEGYENLPG